ncbi:MULTISPECIES: three-helix bundle dimerization domain-containing protein [unclassified Streptomyces]|uniref:Uncharacterized protein n=1 Tax=Streptomyces sp. 900105245 TaxID=3154379 RepID=A0ABV1U177_9ACTN
MATESEEASLTRHVAERLLKAHPQVDPGLVRKTVRTAYEEFKYARVRTYLPILMERRADDLLPYDEPTDR